MVELEGDSEVDLVLPPGTPRAAIRDALLKFDVQLVGVTRPLTFANMDHDERELLAFRGSAREVERVRDFIYHEIRKFLGEE